MKAAHFINLIIKDFEAKRIVSFLKLEDYETNIRINRFLKILKIDFANKYYIKNSKQKFHISFSKKRFRVWCPYFSKLLPLNGTFIKDKYDNYLTEKAVYEKIISIIDDIDNYLEDMEAFNTIDKLIVELNNNYRKDIYKSVDLFWKIHAIITRLEAEGKIIVTGKHPLSFMKTLYDTEDREMLSVNNCTYVLNERIKYRLGFCIRGWPLVERT